MASLLNMSGGALVKKGEEIIMTSISNPEVLAICYAQGWATSPNYMLKKEAEAVTSIDSSVFRNNTSITHFEEFEYFGVTALSDRAFQYCTNLQTITLPSAINTISAFCFYGCSNLESLTAGTITTLGGAGFQNCSKLKSWTFSSNLTSIGDACFAGCTSIVFTNDIPSTLTTLGGQAFQNVGFTGHLTIPSGITSIGQRTFQGAKLTSVSLPSTCTEIGLYAFYGCNQMQSLTILATTPPSLGTSPFQNMTGTIYVPAASVSAYQTAWSNQASRIQAITT